MHTSPTRRIGPAAQPSPDQLIAQQAQRQYGLITRAQAKAIGLSDRQIYRRRDAGHFEQFRNGVWVIAGAPRCWEQSALAAVLAGGPDTMLSCAAAARLWGFERWQRSSAIEVVEFRPRSSRLADVRCHRTTVFEVDRSIRAFIPVTSAERTAIDLSGRLSTQELGRFIDDGLRRDILHLDRLIRCASRLLPARGRQMSNVWAVMERRIPGWHPGDSNFEVRVAGVLRSLTHLPTLVHQHPFSVGDRTYFIDLAHPHQRIAHECDGWEFHRTRSAFSNDRARANDLAAHGWTVLRYTTDMSDEDIARYATATFETALTKQRHAS